MKIRTVKPAVRAVIMALVLATVSGGYVNAQVSTFTGQKKDMDWHEFCHVMETNATARTDFTTGLQLSAAVDANVGTFLLTPNAANFATMMGSGGLTLNGGTSGSISLVPDDVTANDITIYVDPQTGLTDKTLHIPDVGEISGQPAFVFTNVTQELSGKTVTGGVIKDGFTASGSTSNDFSGSTGTFKTSSGANTLSGDVTIAANKNVTAASGTTAVDYSAASGTFKTSTGLNTWGGKATLKAFPTPIAPASPTPGPAQLGTGNIVTITGSTANTRGVKLATGATGDVVWVFNEGATGANIYPATGGTINGGAANAGAAIPASTGVVCVDIGAADTWRCMDMPATSGAAN